MLLEDLEKFFQDHPLKKEYFNHSDDERSGTFAVALRDIRALLGDYQPTDDDMEFFRAAVAEQTLFLLLNPEYLTGVYAHTAALTAAGSSRKFSNSDSPLGQRAAALLAPLLKKAAAVSKNDSAANGSSECDGYFSGTLTLNRG